MTHTLQQKPNGQQIYFQGKEPSYLELECMAYKAIGKLDKGITMGPLPENTTHIDPKKKIGPNTKTGVQLHHSPMFVVKRPNMDKWREVVHFGAAAEHGKSFNDCLHQDQKSIYYSSPNDL